MEATPPKTLKSKLVHLDHSLKDIERQQYPGIQRAPGSLPVLEAFQEFLDKERAKAAKRLRLVTVFMLLLFAVTLAGGAAFIYFQMKRSATDYAGLSSQTEALQHRLAEATNQSARAINDVVAQLKESSNEQRNLLLLHSNVVARVDDESSTVAALKERVDALLVENKALKSELKNISRNWDATDRKIKELEALQTALAERVKKQVEVKPPRPSRPRHVAPKAATVSRPAPAGGKSTIIPLVIKPAGQSTGIRWRLPKVN